MKRIIANHKAILFTVFTWVVLLWLVNFSCGLIVKNSYIAVDPINEKTAKTTWGYFKPNQEKIILFPGMKGYKVTIDSLGLRSTGYRGKLAINTIADKYKILAIGDSITFGTFVDDEDSYPYRLQQILYKNNTDAVVLNAGIGSSTITDFLHYLKIKGLKLKPDVVAISFCENDLNGMDDELVYERMKKKSILTLFETFKLAKFMRMGRKIELGLRYKRSTNKIKDERVKDILLSEKKGLDDALYAAAHASGKAALDPAHPDLRDAWKRYLAVLDETIDLLQKEKIEVVFVIYPHILTVFDKTESNYQDILTQHLKGKNVHIVDPLPLFKQRKEEFLSLYNAPPRDFHLSGEGSQIVAQQVYAKIKKGIR